MPSVLPNFLVIGAGKAGTTSLHRWLGAHPQVFVTALKETNYFAYAAHALDPAGCISTASKPAFPIRGWDEYLTLFRRAASFDARGEVSPAYLAWPGVPERIAERIPGARLVAILRHPVDRAYSSFLMHSRDGREKRSFEEAVRQEIDETADLTLAYGQLNYLRIGLYDQHLSRFFRRVDAARIHVELYDDLVSNPAGLLRRIYRFLGVDETFVADLSTRLNPSGVPRSRLLAPLLRKSRVSNLARAFPVRAIVPRAERIVDRWRARHLVKPPLDPALRAALITRFSDDVRRLEIRLGRDLSAWLEG